MSNILVPDKMATKPWYWAHYLQVNHPLPKNIKKQKSGSGFGPSRLFCTFQIQLRRQDQGLGAGVSIRAVVQRKGWQKEMAYLERAVCTFYTAAAPPSYPSAAHFSPTFCLLHPLHPPSAPPLLPGSGGAFNTCAWKGQLCERPALSSHPQDASACPVQ